MKPNSKPNFYCAKVWETNFTSAKTMIANLIFVRDCKVKYVRFENIRVVEEFGYFGNALYFEKFSLGFYNFFWNIWEI